MINQVEPDNLRSENTLVNSLSQVGAEIWSQELFSRLVSEAPKGFACPVIAVN
jgi:hypothetical protein